MMQLELNGKFFLKMTKKIRKIDRKQCAIGYFFFFFFFFERIRRIEISS